MCVFVCICVSVYPSRRVREYVCISILYHACVFLYVCMCMCSLVFKFVCVYVLVYIFACVYVHRACVNV